MKLIDGKKRAAVLRESVAKKTARFIEQTGHTPGLAVVIVGEDPASQVYVKNKVRGTEEVGMASFHKTLSQDISEADLLAVISELNDDTAVDGILVQLPLPDHMNSTLVIAAIDPKKDVDGFHPVNAGLLATGCDGMIPCTPKGCMVLLEEELGDLSGLEALVIGRSNIVGKPIAQLLLAANATVTIAHSRTKELSNHLSRADIVIAAIGVPGGINGAAIKPGATVIDVGINRVTDKESGKNRLIGDVATENKATWIGAITPVPGGVGPMTIACLLDNCLIAACKAHDLDYSDL